jgi:tetratricopeptide (TPR) repeat protein
VLWWRTLAAQDPFSSRVALRLMQALAASGDRAAALQHAKVHAALLREELAVTPDPEVEAFAASLAALPAPAPRPAAPPESPPAPGRESTGPPPASPPPASRPGDEAIAPVVSATTAIPESRRERPSRRQPLRTGLLHPRHFGLILGALLLLVLVASIAAVWRNAKLSGSFTMPWDDGGGSDVISIAVMPFSYKGPPEEDYLGEGLVTLLSTSLNGAGEFRSIDPYVMLSQASERGRGAQLRPDLAGGIAESLRADLFTLGTVVVSGATIRINVSLYDSGPEPGVVASVAVEGTEPGALVDSLTRRLLAGRLDRPADRLARSAVLTTPSLEALKAFLQGEQEFRAARYEQAAVALQEAVRLDPEFALAHYRLSAATAWSFDFDKSVRAAEAAWLLSGHLPHREQRLIAAWRHFVTGDPDEAERLYNLMLAEDNVDVEAWSGLGEVQAHYNPLRGRGIAEAVYAFERVLELAPKYGEARFHLLELGARDGTVAEFDSLLNGVDPASPQLLSWQAARAAAWNSALLPDSLLGRLQEEQDVILGIAAVRTAVHFQELGAAQEMAGLLTRPGHPVGWQAAGHLMIAQGFLARGDWVAARAAIDSSMAVEPAWSLEILGLGALLPQSGVDEAELREVRRLLDEWNPREANPDLTFFFATHVDVHARLRSYLLALLSLRLGDDEAADRYTREIEVPGSGQSGSLGPALRLSVAAHRAHRDGDPERALRLLDEVDLNAPVGRVSLSPFFARSLDRYLRAEALRALNRPQEALPWYASLSDGADLLFWAPAHERQGELHAQLGDAREAERHAERSRTIRAGTSRRAPR